MFVSCSGRQLTPLHFVLSAPKPLTAGTRPPCFWCRFLPFVSDFLPTFLHFASVSNFALDVYFSDAHISASKYDYSRRILSEWISQRRASQAETCEARLSEGSLPPAPSLPPSPRPTLSTSWIARWVSRLLYIWRDLNAKFNYRYVYNFIEVDRNHKYIL